jgi:uncharacterized membrane protein YoaK (UPF0700 family)
MVTQISNSIVRTTHLTGLFTDLGIELSQLFFFKKAKRTKVECQYLFKVIDYYFFFIGCISGGFLYTFLEIKTLFVAACFF